MADNWDKGFSMPMFRSFVPEKVRPWLYVYLAFTFQLSSGVYLGSLDNMRGSLSLLREDILMCMYASLCGLAVTFPILFRTKFRFTNRTLLLFSSAGIAVLSLLATMVSWLPLLWVICFMGGILKLQGTFECMSNIQLWMTPKRDFAVFFPILHIFIMLSVAVSDILAVWLSYYATWHYMGLLMAGVMLFNTLWLFLMRKHVRFMRKMPLKAIDWLGALLWALFVIQVCFVFCYGEYYNWWESSVIQAVTFSATVTLILALVRMVMIRHPYIQPGIFRITQMSRFIIAALIIEAIMATQHVLEEVFIETGPHFHNPEKSVLNYPVMIGVIIASLFALLWLKVFEQRPVRLMAIGVAAFGAYAIWFYFNISADVTLGQLWMPMLLRGFAVTMMGITMLYMLKTFVHFMVFFQSVAVFQWIHLIIGGVIGAAVYSFGIRYFMADTLANHAAVFDATSFDIIRDADKTGTIMQSMQLATLKRLYGLVAYASLTTVLLILLWDAPYVRNRRNLIPSWRIIGKAIMIRLYRMRIRFGEDMTNS